MHFLYLPSEQAQAFGTSSCCFLVLAKHIQYCKHVERRISSDGLLYCFQTADMEYIISIQAEDSHCKYFNWTQDQ